MKFKPTLITLAVAALATSVQAQVLTKEFYNVKGALNTTMYNAYTGTGVTLTWGRGFTGLGVKVAVLDSGFDLSHTDLKGQVIAAKNFSEIVVENTKTNPNNFKSNIQVGTDITWSLHGTQMASIIAGKADGNGAVGVAPDARLLLAQVGQGVTYSSSTKTWTYSGTGISSSALINALTWAEANGATVANMSLGSSYDNTFQKGVTLLGNGVYKAPVAYGSMYGNTTKELLAFAGASKTMALVASAGNDGLPYAQFPGAYATQVDSKGNLVLGGRMLIVGSVGDNNVISTFSNRAGSFCTALSGTTCKDPYYVKDFFVVAPGEGIISSIANQAKAGNTANAVSGTSPAAAFVSGGIALMKQAWPQLSGAQLVNLVKTTATDLGTKGVDEIYGYGLVNFDKATLPQGLLTIANFKGYNTAIPLTASGVASSGSASIKTSSVLQNVQGLDSYNRNYTLDMTKAVIVNPVATYRSSSSYLAMNATGYTEMSTPVNENYSIKMMQTQTGIASEVTYSQQGASYSVQFGSMTEKSGFLGNYGSGAMAFGDSSTSYLQLGTERKFGDVAVFGSYGLGSTRAGSVQDSMIQLGNRISSSTWKIGVAKNNVFQNKDALSLSVVSPVSVRNGNTTVTGVTGYEFTDNGDGADAKAIVSTETISLRAQVKPMDLVLGYTVIGKGYDRVNVNVARQFNVGGVAGNTANSIGVMAVKSF